MRRNKQVKSKITGCMKSDEGNYGMTQKLKENKGDREGGEMNYL